MGAASRYRHSLRSLARARTPLLTRELAPSPSLSFGRAVAHLHLSRGSWKGRPPAVPTQSHLPRGRGSGPLVGGASRGRSGRPWGAWGLCGHAAPCAGPFLWSVRSPPARAAACRSGWRGRARMLSFQTQRQKPGGERLAHAGVWGREWPEPPTVIGDNFYH